LVPPLLFSLLLLTGCGGGTSSPNVTAQVEGSLDVVSVSEGIGGWAWDSKQPTTPIKVDIYDGDVKLVTVLADQFREDLVTEKKGDGKHAFKYALPDQLQDGKSHTIRVRISGTEQELDGSPKTFKK
jgi:hypothetical protein